MLLLNSILHLSPRGPRAIADLSMGGVAFAGLIFEGGTLAAMASAASFVYFIIQIGKEIIVWLRSKKRSP
ncbi:MAG: hypothetical protein KGJ90_05825 [Patescibacteria group bacterium]|nr:hypothetical protein [Patescibacteria group bacterium]